MDSTHDIKSAIMQSDASGSFVTPTSDLQLVTLGNFLGSDCRGANINWYRQWALDVHSINTGGNASWLRKVEGQIELSNLLDEEEKGNVYFSPKKFIDLIDVWKKISSQHPKLVRIIIEDNRVELELLESFENN